MIPFLKIHQTAVEEVRSQIWDFYKKLLNFKELSAAQQSKQKTNLEQKFNQIFTQHSAYHQLNERLKKTFSKKEKLLRVLDFPNLPLHNNAAELAVRRKVRKRDISLHTMSKKGTQAQDAFIWLILLKLSPSNFEGIQANQKKRRKKKHLKYPLQKGFLLDLFSGIEWKKNNFYGFEKNGKGRALLKSRNFFLEGGVQYQTKHLGIGSTFKFNSLNYKEGTYNYQPLNRRYTSPQIQGYQVLDHLLLVKNNDNQFNFMEGSIYVIAGDQRANFYGGYHRSFQSRNIPLINIPHIAYFGINVSINSLFNFYLKKKKSIRSKKKN